MRFIRHPSEDTPRGHAKDAIERTILSRGYRVGDKLPPYRDLAAHLGVAVRTVVRVMHQLAREGVVQLLHGKGAFIRKMPSGTGRLGAVGLVYPASLWHLARTSYLSQILSGMLLLCEKRHIDLQIVTMRTAEGAVPPSRLAIRVDGMILLEVVNERYIAEFAGEPIPLVLVDAQTQVPGVHSVCVNNALAVNQVMDHLYALGHRRIAYLDVRSQDDLARGRKPVWVDTSDTRERRQGYEAAVRRLRLDYRRMYTRVEQETPPLAKSLAADVSGGRPDAPTAVLCYDDLRAGQLCRLVAAAGVRIPQDLSIAAAVGARGGTVANGHVITCAMANFDQMGRRAIRALERQTADRSAKGPRLERVGSELQVGTSTARRRGR